MEKRLTGSLLGACHELKVCSWLMLQGYDVFRNVAPVGKIDLIAVHRSTKKIRLIEVGTTAAHKDKQGNIKIYIPKHKKDYCSTNRICLVCVDELTDTIFFDPDNIYES